MWSWASSRLFTGKRKQNRSLPVLNAPTRSRSGRNRYSKPKRTPEEQEQARKAQEENERNRLAKLERKRLHQQREANRKAHLRLMEAQKEAKKRRREKPEKEREKKRLRTQEGLELLATYFPELQAAPTVSVKSDIRFTLKAALKDRAHAENWSKRHTKRQFRRLKLGLTVWLAEHSAQSGMGPLASEDTV